MSTATDFLRGIDLTMAVLCILNLAFITDSLTSHRTPPALPPATTSAYLACIVYCLFNVVTLLAVLLLRALPQLCRAAGHVSLASTCCVVQLTVQLFLLLPRTLIILSLLTTVMRSQVVLLGDVAHTVFYLSSALLLFVYSCIILVLDCQRVQRWTAASLLAPQPLQSTDDVRLFGMSVYGGPLWMPENSAATRGLSESEIDRLTTLTTFTPAAPVQRTTHSRAGMSVQDAEGLAQAETTVFVQPARGQMVAANGCDDHNDAADTDPPHYRNPPPPPPPSPAPPRPAQQSVDYMTLNTLDKPHSVP